MISKKYEEYLMKNINFPKECPVCKGKIDVLDNGFVKCSNLQCKQKTIHQFGEALRILEVDGAGESMLESFISNGISNIKMLLSSSNAMAMMGANEAKVASAIVKSLGKPMSMAKFFAMFDFDGFSEKKLSGLEQYAGLGTFYKDPMGTLCGIGDVSAENRAVDNIDGFASYEVKLKLWTEFYSKIREMVLAIPYVKFEAPTEGLLTGLSFCFTGAMAYKRPVLENLVTSNGGAVKGVSKGLSYLVQADENSTSTKSKKARELGTKIISPDTFINMLIDMGVVINL